MRRQVVASARAGESLERTAERVIDLDDPLVRMPEHVRELRAAARAAASGDVEARREFESVVSRWERRIEALGEGRDGGPGAFTMRSSTQQLVADLRDARAEHVDRIVDRWTLDRAKYQARQIARHETIEAYRDGYQRQAAQNPAVKGFRWLLSPNHPKPDVCFVAGTMVETIDGPRPIETIAVGTLVLTHAGRFMPVLATSRTTPAGGLLRLRFQGATSPDREVVATPNHPFAAAQGWTPAGALRTGDAVLALASDPTTTACQRSGDSSHRDRSGSPQSAPCARQQTTDAARRAEPRSPESRTDMSSRPQGSTPTPPSESGRPRSPWSRPTNSDCPLPCGRETGGPEPLPASTTCQGDASRGSDSPNHDSQRPCTSSSSSDRSGCSCSERTAPRTSRTAEARGDGGSGSTRSSSTSGQHQASECRTSHTADAARSEPRPRTSESRIDDGLSPFLRGLRSAWGEGRSRTPHSRELRSACLVSVAREWSTTNAQVFNLEVAEDHTYFAQGVLVHNCDLLANQNLYGLGPGGYPVDAVPPTPHVNCMCSTVAITDRFHSRRELARMKGEPEPPREWEVGGRETAAEWLGRQPDTFVDSLLGPTRAPIFRQEPHRVISPLGAPIPVHQVLGLPPPQRRLGPAVRARPLVRDDRASMVEPFPDAPSLPPGDSGRRRR